MLSGPSTLSKSVVVSSTPSSDPYQLDTSIKQPIASWLSGPVFLMITGVVSPASSTFTQMPRKPLFVPEETAFLSSTQPSDRVVKMDVLSASFLVDINMMPRLPGVVVPKARLYDEAAVGSG